MGQDPTTFEVCTVYPVRVSEQVLAKGKFLLLYNDRNSLSPAVSRESGLKKRKIRWRRGLQQGRVQRSPGPSAGFWMSEGEGKR